MVKLRLGSDKVNIEEIKEARDEFIKVNEYILELANNQFSGLSLQARIKHEKFMQGFDSLLYIIEQLNEGIDEALKHSKGAPYDSIFENKDRLLEVRSILQAIRK
jgi:hypothetical protein